MIKESGQKYIDPRVKAEDDKDRVEEGKISNMVLFKFTLPVPLLSFSALTRGSIKVLLKLVIALCFFAIPASASADKTLLKQIENYLNGITSLVAEFNQVTPMSDPVKGKIWLKRSSKDGGKMRLDYEPRIQQRVVARDDQLFVYDLTDKTDPLPQNLSNMPAAFILQNNISLERDASVQEIVKSPDGKYLALHLLSPADLTLTFSLYENGNIKDLVGWVLIDPPGQEIIVELTKVNVNDNSLTPDSLFKAPFKDFMF